MAAVSALDIQPGQHVLDLCAAPGGKSTQIAALLFGEGFLASNEYVASRAKILSQNTERLGVQNAIVTNETPTRLAERWGAGFDRVLVDAPCSGEGMFRREAQARAEWTPQSPEGCANRQAQILDAAADMVRPGGLLVYSTCTFNEMENEGTVERFVARHPEFAPEEFSLPGIGASTKGCLRLWPHRIQGEGHFVARLRKSGPQTTPVKEDPTRIPTQELLSAFADITLYGTLHWAGDTCWLLPPGCLPLDGLRVLRSGLCLGHRREKLFLPDHAIAMAFPPDRFAQSLPLDDALAVRYLRGETLPADGLPNGWAVASYGGLSLGWGKVVDGTLKNHLPKGLRRMA